MKIDKLRVTGDMWIGDGDCQHAVRVTMITVWYLLEYFHSCDTP